MLIIAQGTIYRPVTDQERRAAAAWLGPMTDAGFLHGGWIDPAGNRLWMVISAPDLADIRVALVHLSLCGSGLQSTVRHGDRQTDLRGL